MLFRSGLLQGSNASLMGMAGIVGPLFFTQVLAWFVVPRAGVTLPGAPFLVGASLFAVAWFVAWRFARLPATAPTAEPSPPSPPAPPSLEDSPGGL